MNQYDGKERHAWIGPTIFTVVLIATVLFFVWFLSNTH